MPAVLVAAAVVLGIAMDPAWFAMAVAVPLAPPFLMYVTLFVRNRRTGIRLDQRGVTIGALESERGRFQAPWTVVRSARVERDTRVIEALMISRRLLTPTRWWGVPRGMGEWEFAAGVLVPPFARAALVVEFDAPAPAEGVLPRPAWYFGNRTNVSYFAKRRAVHPSTIWISPTRHPDRLADALTAYGLGCADGRIS